MPARWFVPLEGLDPSRVQSHHWHAAITRWFDEDPASHTANRKPYSVSPPTDDPSAGAGVGVQIGTLTDDAAARLMKAAYEGASIRLGSARCVVSGPPRVLRSTSWMRLSATPTAVGQWQLTFLTPATFRSANRSSPLPQLRSMLTNLAEVWNLWSPVALDGVLAEQAARAAWVSDLDLRSASFRSPLTRGADPQKAIHLSGSLGSMTIRCDEPDVRPVVGALLGMTEYAGVGAMTVRGLGVTEVVAGARGAGDLRVP